MTPAKVGSGQPLRITAEAFNAFVDAAAAYQATRQSQTSAGGGTTAVAGVVLVRNETGAHCERFSVLGLGDPLILPNENAIAFQERVAFRAVSPEADIHAHRFAILQEPLPAGAVGRGLVAGITPVRLTVESESDEAAAVATDEATSLSTGAQGGARVLWKEGGTGEKWGIVLLPSGGSEGGSPNLVLEVAAIAHGWDVGEAVRWTGAGWARADAAVIGPTDLIAVVGRVPDADTALVVLWGLVCLDGLEPHTDYWLDPAVAGGLTSVRPAAHARLVLHHAEGRLCVLRSGSAGSGGGGAERFADLTDVDVTSVLPADGQAALWNAAAERWRPRDVIIADAVPAHQVLAGPVQGGEAKPVFREAEVGDLAAVPATSVLANAAAGAARPTAVAADTDDRALLRVGGSLQWLQIPGAVLADGAVSSAKLADGAVTDGKVSAVSWGKIMGAPTTFPPAEHAHALGGDLEGTTSQARLAAGAVATGAIADGAVTLPKLATKSLTIVAGAGLAGGGEVTLGGSIVLSATGTGGGGGGLSAIHTTGPLMSDGDPAAPTLSLSEVTYEASERRWTHSGPVYFANVLGIDGGSLAFRTGGDGTPRWAKAIPSPAGIELFDDATVAATWRCGATVAERRWEWRIPLINLDAPIAVHGQAAINIDQQSELRVFRTAMTPEQLSTPAPNGPHLKLGYDAGYAAFGSGGPGAVVVRDSVSATRSFAINDRLEIQLRNLDGAPGLPATRTITLRLDAFVKADGSPASVAPLFTDLDIRMREFDVCIEGETKRILLLASQAYG